MTMLRGTLAALAASILAAAAPASAHHAFNMFDSSKTVSVDATVKAYKWAMPHVWINVLVSGPAGVQAWAMECHSPNIIARKGWKSSTIKPGDRIKITMHPMRDGSPTGSVMFITLADGRILWNAESETAQ